MDHSAQVGDRTAMRAGAWLVAFLASAAPIIIWRESVGDVGLNALLIGQVAVLVLLRVGARWSVTLFRLRDFIVMLTVGTAGTLILVIGVAGSATWGDWFPATSFAREMLGIQLPRLVVALACIAVLLRLGYRRKEFLLTAGDVRAPITPVRWLGFPRPIPWTRFGGLWAVFISSGTLAFILLSGGIPEGPLLRALVPVMPAVVLFGLVNAFAEGVIFRVALLPTLGRVLEKRDVLLVTSVYFGVAHYYGVPYGLVGVLMATFLGWMLGKAMLETRGFVWAWLIHFCQDVIIFAFLAMSMITPGG